MLYCERPSGAEKCTNLPHSRLVRTVELGLRTGEGKSAGLFPERCGVGYDALPIYRNN